MENEEVLPQEVEQKIKETEPEGQVIEQVIVPSYRTKLVCSSCGREDFHTGILRNCRGLYELLCKQNDGSGCYPNSSQVLCRWTDSDQLPCNQLAEYEVLDSTGRKITESCSEHLGRMLIKGTTEAHQIYPLKE